MYERILRKMREKIHSRDYVMTTHADEEMWEDGLDIEDIENAILNGARQEDRYSDQWKYLIRGESIDSRQVVVVAKIGYTRELVVITVYLE